MLRVKSLLYSSLFLLLLLGSNLCKAGVTASPDSALDYLSTLSDPELFQGRKSGTEIGNKSQRWVAHKFQSWEITPLINDSLLLPYSQYGSVERFSAITLVNSPRYPSVEFLLGDDYTVCANSGSNAFEAEVLLVGHGIDEPEKGWSDYTDIDVHGKIVVILRGTPPVKRQDWSLERYRNYLFTTAVKQGAKAVLFHSHGFPINGPTIPAEAFNDSIPSAYIGDRILHHLLEETGYSIESYKESLSDVPNSISTNKHLHLNFDIATNVNAEGYNVAGIVPGTDPALSNEVIVVGGHGDHTGVNSLGHVYPGADDNGSGASIIMELARNYAKNPQKRSILFCVFGGEEQGLLGSQALVPRLPDSLNYVTMINIDMAGIGDGLFGLGGGQVLGDPWYEFYDSLPDSIKDDYSITKAWGGFSSDHAPFREAGIPAFTGYSYGDHLFYHTPEDQYQSIDNTAIAGAIHSTAKWLDFVANYDQPLHTAHLHARTLWYQGRTFAWQDFNARSLQEDLQNKWHDGYNGIILNVSNILRAKRPFETWKELADLSKIINGFPHLNVGSKRSHLGKSRGQMNSSILLSANAESIRKADAKAIELFRNHISWVQFNNADEYFKKGTLKDKYSQLLISLIEQKFQIEIPLADASRFNSVFEELPEETLFTGTLTEYTALDEKLVKTLREHHFGILLFCDRSNVSILETQLDSFEQYRIHVQPCKNADGEQTLQWTESLINELKLPNKQILDLLYNHYRLW